MIHTNYTMLTDNELLREDPQSALEIELMSRWESALSELEEKEDDFKRKSWAAQIDGSKAGREMPGIVDEVITMALIRPEEGPPYRAFVTDPANEWGFPAKDRSGRLDPMEKPHLGDLFAKLNDTAGASRAAA